ncbi:MAG: GNAT family N-acetyltransferase [Chloroflexi bacterium]|nr:GNAT family N-acetyltransferase [Chloroflexota bacterium]
MLKIRPFTPADQSAARQLILAGLGQHFGWIDESRNPDLDDLQRHYLDQGHLFVVAEKQGVIVGTGALKGETPGVSRMVRISVSLAHQRQGIGRQLVTHLMQQAWARGDQRIVVETNLDWWDAIGLYHSLGFSQYDQDEESVHLHLYNSVPQGKKTKD